MKFKIVIGVFCVWLLALGYLFWMSPVGEFIKATPKKDFKCQEEHIENCCKHPDFVPPKGYVCCLNAKGNMYMYGKGNACCEGRPYDTRYRHCCPPSETKVQTERAESLPCCEKSVSTRLMEPGEDPSMIDMGTDENKECFFKRELVRRRGAILLGEKCIQPRNVWHCRPRCRYCAPKDWVKPDVKKSADLFASKVPVMQQITLPTTALQCCLADAAPQNANKKVSVPCVQDLSDYMTDVSLRVNLLLHQKKKKLGEQDTAPFSAWRDKEGKSINARSVKANTKLTGKTCKDADCRATCLANGNKVMEQLAQKTARLERHYATLQQESASILKIYQEHKCQEALLSDDNKEKMMLDRFKLAKVRVNCSRLNEKYRLILDAMGEINHILTQYEAVGNTLAEKTCAVVGQKVGGKCLPKQKKSVADTGKKVALSQNFQLAPARFEQETHLAFAFKVTDDLMNHPEKETCADRVKSRDWNISLEAIMGALMDVNDHLGVDYCGKISIRNCRGNDLMTGVCFNNGKIKICDQYSSTDELVEILAHEITHCDESSCLNKYKGPDKGIVQFHSEIWALVSELVIAYKMELSAPLADGASFCMKYFKDRLAEGVPMEQAMMDLAALLANPVAAMSNPSIPLQEIQDWYYIYMQQYEVSEEDLMAHADEILDSCTIPDFLHTFMDPDYVPPVVEETWDDVEGQDEQDDCGDGLVSVKKVWAACGSDMRQLDMDNPQEYDKGTSKPTGQICCQGKGWQPTGTQCLPGDARIVEKENCLEDVSDMSDEGDKYTCCGVTLSEAAGAGIGPDAQLQCCACTAANAKDPIGWTEKGKECTPGEATLVDGNAPVEEDEEKCPSYKLSGTVVWAACGTDVRQIDSDKYDANAQMPTDLMCCAEGWKEKGALCQPGTVTHVMEHNYCVTSQDKIPTNEGPFHECCGIKLPESFVSGYYKCCTCEGGVQGGWQLKGADCQAQDIGLPDNSNVAEVDGSYESETTISVTITPVRKAAKNAKTQVPTAQNPSATFAPDYTFSKGSCEDRAKSLFVPGVYSKDSSCSVDDSCNRQSSCQMECPDPCAGVNCQQPAVPPQPDNCPNMAQDCQNAGCAWDADKQECDCPAGLVFNANANACRVECAAGYMDICAGKAGQDATYPNGYKMETVKCGPELFCVKKC